MALRGRCGAAREPCRKARVGRRRVGHEAMRDARLHRLVPGKTAAAERQVPFARAGAPDAVAHPQRMERGPRLLPVVAAHRMRAPTRVAFVAEQGNAGLPEGEKSRQTFDCRFAHRPIGQGWRFGLRPERVTVGLDGRAPFALALPGLGQDAVAFAPRSSAWALCQLAQASRRARRPEAESAAPTVAGPSRSPHMGDRAVSNPCQRPNAAKARQRAARRRARRTRTWPSLVRWGPSPSRPAAARCDALRSRHAFHQRHQRRPAPCPGPAPARGVEAQRLGHAAGGAARRGPDDQEGGQERRDFGP
jgi:hypothetical protein